MSILTKQQILELLQESDQDVIAELYRQADRVRQEQVGENTVYRRFRVQTGGEVFVFGL